MSAFSTSSGGVAKGRRRLSAVAAASLSLGLLPVGLTAANAASVPAKKSPASAPVPQLSWADCPRGWGTPPEFIDPEDPMSKVKFSCATAKVPLDHDDPYGKTVSLALRRIEATDPAKKVGTLFINPGGPGGSGVEFTDSAWALYGPDIRAKFDIVGFDPRGIGRSDGLACFESFQQARRTYGTVESFPINKAEHNEIMTVNSKIAALCKANGGPIAAHLSTANVVRDLDLLRQAVGDQKLTYAGYSYGTQIGSTYAAMYPGKVRAMVIDAVLDPVKWTTGSKNTGTSVPMTTRLGSHTGAQATLNQFFSLCRQAGPQKCTLMTQGDPAEIFAKVTALAKKEPIRIDMDGYGVMELTYQDTIGLSLGILYSSTGWELLSGVISMMADQTGIAPLPKAAKVASLKRAKAFAGAPMPTVGEGANAVICEDSRNPSDPDAWWTASRRADRSSYFGSSWTYMSGQCASWQLKDADAYMGPFATTTAKPVLVIGNLYDPATPYSGAQAANRNLRGSRLLTVATWGHAALGVSKCVDNAVNAYITNGALPAVGTTCQPDYLPFSSDAEVIQQQKGATAKARTQARLKAQHYVARVATGGRAWTDRYLK